jgi:hypothetical protein
LGVLLNRSAKLLDRGIFKICSYRSKAVAALTRNGAGKSSTDLQDSPRPFALRCTAFFSRWGKVNPLRPSLLFKILLNRVQHDALDLTHRWGGIGHPARYLTECAINVSNLNRDFNISHQLTL